MFIHIDRELCSGCGNCPDACQVGAINFENRWPVVDVLFNMLERKLAGSARAPASQGSNPQKTDREE
jgi:ferredoxin